MHKEVDAFGLKELAASGSGNRPTRLLYDQITFRSIYLSIAMEVIFNLFLRTPKKGPHFLRTLKKGPLFLRKIIDEAGAPLRYSRRLRNRP